MGKFIFSFLVLMPVLGWTSEGHFSYLYLAETTPANTWEYEQKHAIRMGKARGDYTAFEMRNEFEYGITDFLQTALYINSSYLNTSNQYDPEDVSQNFPDRNEWAIDGISIEIMYRMLSPYKDGIGLAWYVEPELKVRDNQTGEDQVERAIEMRLILQKNFLDDQMMTAFNIMLEPEWEKVGGLTKKELWVEFTLGATYRWRPNWFIGLELRNHMEFVDMRSDRQEHSAYFAGPTLHYGSEHYWWTVTVMPQIAGWPSVLGTGADGRVLDGGNVHLGQHEKMEVRFAFGIPLTEGHKHSHD